AVEADVSKMMEATAELLRQDFLPQANATGQRVQSNLNNLKRGVERAAESVLGDDTEALRLAKQELDQLMDQLQRESAQANDGTGKTNQSLSQASNEKGPPRANEPGARADQQAKAQGSGQRPGETAQTAAQDGQANEG